MIFYKEKHVLKSIIVAFDHSLHFLEISWSKFAYYIQLKTKTFVRSPVFGVKLP